MASNRQGGFSLIEVMVAASLLAALSYAGIKLMSDQSKAQKTVESRSEITSVLSDMRTILSKEQSCLVTFGGRNINTAEGVVTRLTFQEYFFPPTLPIAAQPPQIQRYQSNTNPNAGQVYGNGNIKILGYRLDGSVNTIDGTGTWSTNPSGNRTGSINLIVRFYIGHHRAQGAEIVQRKIPLFVEINGADQIIKCSATGGVGIDSRYLQRMSTDPTYRTMMDDLIIGDGYRIMFPSDRNLKYEIKSLRETLSKIRKLKPVHYKWRSNHSSENGLIAQEVEKVFPDLVKTNEYGVKSVDYIKLTPLILKATQEVDAENSKLKKSIDTLKEEQLRQKQELEVLKYHVCQSSPSLDFCN